MPRPGIRALLDQLLRAGTAVGANLEEAKAASTKREFLRDVEISLREAREAWYWLRLYDALDLGERETVARLIREAEAEVRILSAIVLSTRRRMITVRALVACFVLTSAYLLS